MQNLRPVRRCGMTVSTVAVSPDESLYLYAGGSPGQPCPIHICDAATHKTVLTLEAHKKPLIRARFLDDGSIVSMSFDSHVIRWTSAGEIAASNETHLSHRADGFALTSDGKLALTGDYRGAVTGWKLKDGKSAFTMQASNTNQQIWSLAINPENKLFATGGAQGKIEIWDLAKRRSKGAIELGLGQHIYALAWSSVGIAAAIVPDGLAPETARCRVAVFDPQSLTEIRSLSTSGHEPYSCNFSPDGRYLAAAGGGTDRGGSESKKNCVIHIWDTATGEEVAALAGHSGLVRDLVFSQDSTWMMSAGWDDTLRSWALELPA